MEGFSGSKKRKTSSGSSKIVARSSDTGKSTGNVKLVGLPHLVMGKILEHLNFKDLLQCSLVNKLWNHEARRLLREKHECLLALHLDRISAEDIDTFVKTLTEGLPVPYVGLSIRMKVRVSAKRLNYTGCKLAVCAINHFILQAGPIKVVQLDFGCNRQASFEVLFIREVLAEVHMTLKVLKIKNLAGLRFKLKGFPELKKLEVDLESNLYTSYYSYLINLQNVISVAPKLESFTGCLSPVSLKIIEKLPPSRIAVAKKFTCADMSRHRGEVAEFAKLGPKLEKLIIPRNFGDLFRKPKPVDTSIAKSLLLSSEATLIELQVTYEMLEHIRDQKPSVSFANVRKLTVNVPWNRVKYGFDRTIIIAALFPKLENLAISRGAQPPAGYDYDEYIDEIYEL